MFRGKNYKESAKLIDKQALYDPMEALQLGRRTMDLVHQNFMATILVNSSAMLLGALGRINPLWAAVIHNTATLAVVLNSCRILRPNAPLFARSRRRR